MSQILVTGEAKIRDIQGPVVANSGVVTALDGAASQYVRGDGTLADFPTSSGGGSSVSYYLNSSVSQGTIGGVAYRELSKDPIIGTGTDIAISSNGYVANYLTDANDPDVVLVPGGNFNCEFYFSVNNNTGNPFTYAELYKYDGTTFTLLGSSVGVPEYINQGTIIAPYYFAIPVPSSPLALTDRLAIRIYVNVDGRTVTLHTENSHLCQVVTTLSKGMVSLNNLTDQSQYLTIGTSGTDFNIVSSGDTHTFNIPSASATNRGLITTGSQTFSGSKTFSNTTLVNTIYIDGVSYLKNLTSTSYITGYTTYSAKANGVIEYFFPSSFKSVLDFNDAADYTYTFPAASGTIALTSNLSSYVPYTGATGAVDLGTNELTSGNAKINDTLYLKLATTYAHISGYYGISVGTNIFVINNSASTQAVFSLASLTTSRTFTLPDANGMLALTSNLSAYLPLTGGTLTGALSGTSANFSSSVTASGSFVSNVTNGYGLILNRAAVTNYNGISLQTASAGQWFIGMRENLSSNNFIIYNENGTDSLTIARSNSAATFSSSVTANSLIVDGNPLSASFNSSTGVYTRYKYNGTNVGIIGTANQIIGGGSTTAFAIGTESNDYMLFLTNNAERLRITSGGNVGIGVVPSASDTYPALQIGRAGFMGAGNEVNISSNGYYSSPSWKYIASDTAALYNISGNVHSWYTAVSGTANAAISWVERMRITSGGNVLINKTSNTAASINTSGTLQVNSEIMATGSSAGLFWENRSGGVTTNSNWYGWYTTSGTIFLWNGSSNIAQINTSSGAYTALSDVNKKKDFEDSTIGLDAILGLKPTLYRMTDEDNTEKHLGFIAQEVKEFIPQAYIQTKGEKEDFIGLDDRPIIAALVKAIQEQQAQIEELKALIAAK